MLKLLAQIMALLCGFILAGSIIRAMYHYILSIQWLATSVTIMLIIGFLSLLHYLAKRVWD